LSQKVKKNFWGGGTAPSPGPTLIGEGDTPSPPSPRRLRRLAPYLPTPQLFFHNSHTDGSTKEFSMSARSAWSTRLSQKDCLPGNGSGGGPAEVDQDDRHESRNESVGQGNCARLFLENEGARRRGQKGRNCERGHPSYPQATMFDWHRGLQPLSVKESRICNTGDCQSQVIIKFLKCRVVS